MSASQAAGTLYLVPNLLGAVPPEAETVIVVVLPLQAIAGPCDEDALNAVGSVMVIEVVAVHPLLSVTV